MTILLDKPPCLGTGSPSLPPYLQKKREPRREWYIVPDIRFAEYKMKTQHDNTWTIHWFWMNRVLGFYEQYEVAHVNSRRYRQWLETYEMKDGIPPHIQFGGAVVAGTGDPEFYNRWVRYAQETFY